MMEGSEREKHWFQILAVMIAGLSALTNGIFFTWPNSFFKEIMSNRESYDISLQEASILPLINEVTAMITCPLFSLLSDVYGRKRILLLLAITDLTAWIVKATASSICTFYLARIFVGLSHSIMYSTLPSYIGEVSSPKIRGTWGNSWTFFFTLGELLAIIVGSYLSIETTSYIFIPIPILFFLSFLFMPESPYYYIMTGDHIQAKKSLRTLKRKVDVESEFLVIEADIKRHMSKKSIFKDLVTIKRNRRALTAGMFLRISQLFGGIAVFGIYAQDIFNTNGILTPEVSLIIYYGMHFMLVFVACFLVDIVGRRIAFIGSLLPCGAILFLESIYFYIYQKHPGVDLSFFKWVPLAGMVLHMIFYSFGSDIVPTLMIAELFSTSIRARALMISLILCVPLTFVLSFLLFFLYFEIGMYAAFLFFGACNILSAIVAFFVVPETKGKTLEQIQESLEGRNPYTVFKKYNTRTVRT